jgi:putative ABC transport system permease protein
MQDLRYAIRGLVKSPGFTLIAVLTLALGIGANTAIFTLVDALLLKPLPFRQPDELMIVHMLRPDPEAGPGMFREMVWSYPKYQAFAEQQTVFADHGLFTPREWTLTGAGDPERLQGELIGAGYLPTLGITPPIGRNFLASEDRTPGIQPVVMIGYGLWQRRFGGDPRVLGRTIGLNAIPHTIVGVLPPDFHGMFGAAQVWVPVMTLDAKDLAQKWAHSYLLVARLKAGVSEGQARSAVTLIGQRIDEAFPDPRGVVHTGATAISLDASRVDPLIRRSALVLLGAVGFVLVIGCVNLANLLLARGIARQREVAIRLAIGATRGRLVRQFLTESLLLASLGAIVGVGIAAGAMRLATALMPDSTIVLRMQTFALTRVGLNMIGLDMTALVFTIAIAGATAVLVGLAPAWQSSRADVVQTMKAGGAGSIAQGTRGLGVRNVLIVGETALALVLLVASGLMLQSVRNLQQTGLGFEPDGLVTFAVALPGAQYDEPRAQQFFAELIDRLRVMPGVTSVAFGNCLPVSGGCNSTTATFPDRPPVSPDAEPPVGVYWASPEYFSTLAIRVIKGRTFTDRDRDGQPKVIVINETAARTFFGRENPLGKRVGLGQGAGFQNGAEVVGVVADVRYVGVERPAVADAYLPLRQSPRFRGSIIMRTSAHAATIGPAIRATVRSLDRDLPVDSLKTMGDRFGEATWRTRLSANLLGLFAALALLLAAIGLYGVMSQAVEQRTREIGLRIALGAERRAIVMLVTGRAAIVVLVGIGVGVVLSLVSMPLLETLLYRVRPNDPATLAVLAATLLAVALLASYVPARRATRVDPLTSLRAE